MTICIGREYGSGGHEIGKRLAAALNYNFYDHELVEKAVMSHNPPDIAKTLAEADEKKTGSWLHKVHYSSTDSALRGLSTNDILFRLQSDIIIDLATQGNCVFIGRCSDYILKQQNIPRLSLFVTAPFPDRLHRIMQLHDLDEKSAAALIRKTDKQRKSYYDYYTSHSWGKPHNYDLCINSSSLGIDDTAKLLSSFYQSLSDLAN